MAKINPTKKSKIGIKFAKKQYGSVLQLKVSFKMGPFSDP